MHMGGAQNPCGPKAELAAAAHLFLNTLHICHWTGVPGRLLKGFGSTQRVLFPASESWGNVKEQRRQSPDRPWYQREMITSGLGPGNLWPHLSFGSVLGELKATLKYRRAAGCSHSEWIAYFWGPTKMMSRRQKKLDVPRSLVTSRILLPSIARGLGAHKLVLGCGD